MLVTVRQTVSYSILVEESHVVHAIMSLGSQKLVEGQSNSIILLVRRRKSCSIGVRKSVTCMLLKVRQTVSHYMCIGGSHAIWVLHSW